MHWPLNLLASNCTFFDRIQNASTEYEVELDLQIPEFNQNIYTGKSTVCGPHK